MLDPHSSVCLCSPQPHLTCAQRRSCGVLLAAVAAVVLVTLHPSAVRLFPAAGRPSLQLSGFRAVAVTPLAPHRPIRLGINPPPAAHRAADSGTSRPLPGFSLCTAFLGAGAFSAAAIVGPRRRSFTAMAVVARDPSVPPVRYAYLHGFLSGPASKKGTFLKQEFARWGHPLELLDLNDGDPCNLRFSTAIAVVERFLAAHPAARIRLIGSSFGGYVAARCAELFPDRIDRLLLLCPGFDLGSRWPVLFGADEMRRWREEGTRSFTTSRGGTVAMPYAFIDDSQQHPPYPHWRCPVVILQGSRDEVVPEALIQAMLARDAALSARTYLRVVDDNHDLTAPDTLDLLSRVANEFLVGCVDPNGDSDPHSNEVQERRATVEVERKYRGPPMKEFAEALTRNGAHLKARERFEDVYWDGEEIPLLRRDHWLRQRAGVWELKRPPASGAARVRQVTAYEEISDNPSAIGAALDPILGVSPGAVAAALSEREGDGPRRVGLAPFARFVSERAKYGLPGGLGVDVDRAEYPDGHGEYSVVEIEKVVHEGKDEAEGEAAVRRAGAEIEVVARSLGLDPVGRVPGKLEHFLRIARPEHWAVLQSLLAR